MFDPSKERSWPKFFGGMIFQKIFIQNAALGLQSSAQVCLGQNEDPCPVIEKSMSRLTSMWDFPTYSCFWLKVLKIFKNYFVITCLFIQHLFYCRFPFYYEVKILLLIWLISPVSRGSLGSSILYRRFVHPSLVAREEVCFLFFFAFCLMLFVYFWIFKIVAVQCHTTSKQSWQ